MGSEKTTLGNELSFGRLFAEIIVTPSESFSIKSPSAPSLTSHISSIFNIEEMGKELVRKMKDPDEEEKQEFCWSFSSKGLDLLSHLELLSTNAVAPNEIEIPEPMVVECPTPSGSDLKSHW